MLDFKHIQFLCLTFLLQLIIMAKLILVRHGESEWNKEGRWTGLNDVPLTEKGRMEALRAADYLSTIAIHAAYTSMLDRAIETAKRILWFQDYSAGLVETIALNERDYGIYAGRLKDDVRKEVGEKVFQLIRRSWDYPIEGGDTLKTIHERRIQPFHKSVATPQLQHGKNVLVVSSNNPLRAYVKEIEDIPPEEVDDIELGTAEIRIYYFALDGSIRDRTIHHIGDVH